ncbi:Na+-translocating ferredoxin:NAD+ oxidoreductase RnfC subunit [Clostridium pascui]|uniref:4Fe-4S dicluster domain-containing protein n=1 Tax=Clostridium pascui TaxID=46609 RepID=UPI00195D2A51|nr:4Fe-4S dicluster domain-containing protein [Clostridium pascui]MBM7869102.1 Na+-translocating ferredoxin:NAD+ oxidoreductase RnfC subunit [Clostridium pascui]
MLNNLIDSIKECGLVGAGGAGFPSHVKLSAKCEYVIVNAAECEPLIRVDQQILIHYTKELLEGFNLIIKQTEAKKGYIAIKEKHAHIIDKLSKELTQYDNIEIFKLRDFYPAGDEQVMVNEVINRVVPQGGIPLNVGCIVTNVETVLNAFNATKGNPVTKTFVTITGEVSNPATYRLPIGISYKEALKICGIDNTQGKVLIDGGPMMGKVVFDFNEHITKTTKAIILLDKNHSLIRKKIMSIDQRLKQSKTACIQCSRCTDLCPRNLLGHDIKPHRVMRVVNYGLSDFLGLKTALGCSECGICELYSCPNGLSPRKINVMIKQELGKAGVKIDNSGKNYEAAPMMEYRKIPVKRLIQRLDIKKYDRDAPLNDYEYKPSKVVISLKQHIGAPATAVVSERQSVIEGELIAKVDEQKLGSNIHASISGVITSVNSHEIIIEVE